MKMRIKSMIWNIRKQKATQNNKKKIRIPKNEDSVNSLWDNFKCTNIQIVGVPEGEEKEQEIENLFEKMMKETFPNLVKEIDIQIQEAQTVQNKMDPKRTTSRHTIIKMPKVKDKENLKSSKRKADSYLQRSSHETVSWLLKKKNFAG